MKYAIKKFSKSKYLKEFKGLLDNAISIVKDVSHPSIIKLYEVKEKEN